MYSEQKMQLGAVLSGSL